MSVQLAAPHTSLRLARALPGDGPAGRERVHPQTPAVSPAAGPLRLTRRGRLLLVGAPIMLGGAALLTFIGFFTAPALASGAGGQLTRTQQVSVSTGESLWGLATEYAPERDPRDVVADIMELNNLDDAVVPAGAQLYVPVAG